MLASSSRFDNSAAGIIGAPSSGGTADRLVIAAFMAAYVASSVFGGSGYDTARDVAEAFAIRHLQAFPLHGPILGGALYLGPLWFYLLALPMAMFDSWLGVALFVAVLCSLQFPLAYATGRRLLDRRLGLLWCAMLALPGWGTFELVGFAHTNAVRATTMLVLYALVRLAQERRPRWLVLAVFAWMLALHAHPATAPLMLAVAAGAVYALPNRRALLRWSIAALVLAALLLAPLAIERIIAPATALERPGEYVESMVHVANLAHLSALFYGVLVRGPRVVTDAFFAWAAGVPAVAFASTLTIEGLACIGLIAALRTRRALVMQGVALVLVVAATIALARPATPFYMTYALLPLLAGVGSLGLHRLCALAGVRSAVVAGALVAMLLCLQIASVAGVAQAIASGRVTLSLASRLDVKADDTAPPQPEPWLPAYAVGKSGALLCAQPDGVVLHGTYAYLEDAYFGLDHRLSCGTRDVRLLGATPAAATHLVGLSKALWSALGWQPSVVIGGLGVAPAATILAPHDGHAVPNGLTYPPYPIPAGAARAVQLEAALAGDEALVISFPFRAWLPEPVVRVSADGRSVAPLARDAVSVLYACRPCTASTVVNWHIEFETSAPEWIDVVSLRAPGTS